MINNIHNQYNIPKKLVMSKGVSESSSKSDQELRKVCRDFESIFVNYMMQSMRKTVPKSGFFRESLGIDIAESMYFDVLSRELSKERGIGLADMLYDQLSRYVD